MILDYYICGWILKHCARRDVLIISGNEDIQILETNKDKSNAEVLF